MHAAAAAAAPESWWVGGMNAYLSGIKFNKAWQTKLRSDRARENKPGDWLAGWLTG